MKFSGSLEFEIDIENHKVHSVLTYDPPEVDELTVVALIGTHLAARGRKLVANGASIDRTDNQLIVMLGMPEDDEEGDNPESSS